MKKMYLRIDIKNDNHAGSKAVNDCNAILEEAGFKCLALPLKKDGNKILKKLHNGLAFLKVLRLPENVLLVVPHPIYVNKKYMTFLEKAKKSRKATLVFLIHDLDSVRRSVDNIEDFVWLDSTMYRIADYIISHNPAMTAYLVKQGVARESIVELELFDYLGGSAASEPEFAPVLNIAGNLDAKKSRYLKKLNQVDEHILFRLYGVNFDGRELSSPSISYRGAFSPTEITGQLNCGFGLVWDGEETCSCTGNTGEYLRYNNPHKLSLYIRAGLPVVVWSGCARADFVAENGLGFAVDAIEDFMEEYKKMSPQDYRKMCEAVRDYGEKLKQGYHLKGAIAKIMKKAENQTEY